MHHGNNKFIFHVLEMSWYFTKSGYVLENILPVKTNPLRIKSLEIDIMPAEENFDC